MGGYLRRDKMRDTSHLRKDSKDLKIINKLLEYLEKEPYNINVLEDLFSMCRIVEPIGFATAHETNKVVKKNASQGAVKLSSADHYYLYKRSLLFDAPHFFDDYMLYLEFDRDPDKRFYLPRRRVLKSMIVDHLQDLSDDKLDLLTISLPPGTGKTTLGIFFLSWEMGREPLKPNLASAHSSKLTRSFYDGVYEILTDPEYLWADVFPFNRIVETSTKNETIDLNKPQRYKTLTCRSIDGSLTGAVRCENILYADDLVSGIEEALSVTRLNSLWEKYTNDLKSRKKEGSKEIHIATRWSVHDPIGRLEKQYSNDPRSRFVRVPALDENEESNFEYDYGVGFSTKYFMDMKNTLDDVSWRALFMNEPVEREGLVFPVDELNRYYELPREEPDAVVAVCDTAEGGGDSVCLPVAFLYGQEVYIENVVFDNSLPEVTKPLCANLLMEYNVQQCRFESNSAGGGFADDVQKIIEERGGITHITKKRTTANKLTKIIINSDYIKKNFYFKDESQYMIGSPYYKFMQELTSFTQSGKNNHDDAADAMAQLSEYIQSLEKTKVEIFKRPF
jgi:predicted phage terminase large subunit-like protein